MVIRPQFPRLDDIFRALLLHLLRASPGPPAPLDPQVQEALHVTLQARRELGDEYEEILIEQFLREVSRAIDQRVEERLREYERQRRRGTLRLGLTLILILLSAIPLTLIVGMTAGATGIAILWLGFLALLVILWLIFSQ